MTEEEGRISTRIREIANVVRMVVRTQGEDASTVLHADIEWSGSCEALENRINAALPSQWNAFAEEFRVLPPGDDPLAAPLRRCHVLVMRGCREEAGSGMPGLCESGATVPFTPSLFDAPECVEASEASAAPGASGESCIRAGELLVPPSRPHPDIVDDRDGSEFESRFSTYGTEEPWLFDEEEYEALANEDAEEAPEMREMRRKRIKAEQRARRNWLRRAEAAFSVDALDAGAALDRSSLARISKKDFRRTIVREGGEPDVTFDDGTWSGSLQDARSRGSAANTEISEIRPARRIDEPGEADAVRAKYRRREAQERAAREPAQAAHSAEAGRGAKADGVHRAFSGIEAIMRAYAPSVVGALAAVLGLVTSAAMLLAFPLDASAAEGGNVVTMESLFSASERKDSADDYESEAGDEAHDRDALRRSRDRYASEAEFGREEGGNMNTEPGTDDLNAAGDAGGVDGGDNTGAVGTPEEADGRRRASGNFMGLGFPDSDFEDGGTLGAGDSEMENGGYEGDEGFNGSGQGGRGRGVEMGFPRRSAAPDSEGEAGRESGEPVRAAGRFAGDERPRSASSNSGTDSADYRAEERGILKEKPEESVSRDRVFRRPTIVFKRRDEAAPADGTPKAPPPEKFLFPSMSFLTQFDPWKFRIGDVVLLQDNYASLKRRHPDCRRIEAMDTESSGRIACRNTSLFQAEGSEVIFTYAKVNEILTGAAYAFSSRHRAEQFAQRIESLMKASSIPSYDINPPGLSGEEARTTTAKLSRSVDTPMFIMTVQPSPTGWLVSVDAYFRARIPEAEAYAKAKISMIEFGTLRIGETTKADVLAMTDPSKASSKTCRNVSLVGGRAPAVRVIGENAGRKTADSPSSGSDTQEFYGLCFDFPYEAHMQLDFDPATGILETAVLSPIGISSGGIVEDMLRARYGFPKYCRKTQSEVVLSEIKSDSRRGRARTKRMKDRPSSVFAGTCEEPIIYSADMRFIFENRNLGRAEIMAAYEERKSYVDAAAERLQAFDAKKEKVKGFFE